MAIPHVAGIAALCAEATRLRGFALGNVVPQRARRLAPARDFGWGLVQSARCDDRQDSGQRDHCPRCDLEEVAAAAGALGLRIEHKLAAIGAINGDIDENQLDALSELPGVLSVERGRTVKLPPPASRIQ